MQHVMAEEGYSLDPMQVEEGIHNEVSGDSSSEVNAQERPFQRGRKRVRNPDGWKKRHVKRRGLRSNAPQLSTDDLVGKTCCKNSCIQHLSTEHLTSLRQHFTTLTYDEQNLYLTGLMIRRETKKSVGHKRKSNPCTGKYGKKVGRPPAEESSFSIEYNVRNEKGFNEKVCQRAFVLIHGFGKRRLEILRKKMPVGSTVPEPDRRGKHTNRPMKVSEEWHQKVREHIASFPARQSHYSRHDNPGRLYLSPELSVARMYQLFLSKHDPDYIAYRERRREALVSHQEADAEEIKPTITEHYYHDVFVNEFNIHFGLPRSDTCDTCDSLKVRIEGAATDEEKAKLEQQLQDHLKLADEGYATLRKDIEMCRESWSHVGM